MVDKDEIIEGSAVVVSEEKPDKKLQATVRSRKDQDNKSLKNIMIEAPSANKDAAYFALTQYLVERHGRLDMKDVLHGLLIGHKPKYKREGQKHSWEFVGGDGNPHDVFDVILIEL